MTAHSDTDSRLRSEIVVHLVLGERGRDLDQTTIDRLVSAAEYVTLEPGDILFREGETPQFGHMLVRGKMRLTAEGKAPWVYARPGPLGSFGVGEDNVADRTATAIERSELIRTPIPALFEIFEDDFMGARQELIASVGELSTWLDGFRGRATFPRERSEATVPVPDGPMDLIERLLFLLDVDIVRRAGVQTLAELAGTAEEVRLAEGEILYPPGVARTHAFAIADGEVETARDGARLVFRRGSVVNWGSALANSPHAWVTKATKPTRALVFRLEDWSDAMEEHFTLLVTVLNSLARDQAHILEIIATERGELLVV